MYYEYRRFGGVPNSTLYLDLEYGDIYYTANDYLYGQFVYLWELCDAEGDHISDYWTVRELEEFLDDEEIKNLRQKFIDENGSQGSYTCNEDFYDDKDKEYINFLFDEKVPPIEKGIKEWIGDTYDSFLEQYDDTYWKLLDEE